MSNASPLTYFSLASVPKAQRTDTLREMARALFNMDFVAVGHDPFIEVTGLLLPGVTISPSRGSCHVVSRYDPSRENDDFVLAWARSPGVGRIRNVGREVDGDQQNALLISCADDFRAESGSTFSAMHVRLARSMLLPLLPGAENRLMQPIAPRHGAMRLLNQYLDGVLSQGAIDDPGLAQAVALHICDLVALAAGTCGEGREQAAGRGLRAARLMAIKRWTLGRLANPRLAAGAAAAHGLSQRYVQQLFEDEGTTFTAFVLDARLRLAHRRLAASALSGQSISAIAYDCGFGDLSYFNRAFRQKFGATPSDIRHEAARAPVRSKQDLGSS